jgi:hypothetical protein
MHILTWDPDKRDAAIERTKQIGLEHEGIKVIGTWVDANGGRAFQLNEAPEDPKLGLKANFAWNDIIKIEEIPVIEAKEFLELLASMK